MHASRLPARRRRLLARALLGLLALSLSGAASLAAQELPPPEAPKSKPKPKPKPSGGGGGQSQSTQAPAAPPVLLLMTDLACTVSIDGEQVAKLGAGATRKVNVSIGQHVVTAVSDDGGVKWEQVVETKGAGQQVVVQIDLRNAVGTSPADFDRAAARVWLALDDLKIAGAYAGSILSKSWGFQDRNLSTAVFTAHEFLKRELEEFKKFAPRDVERKRVVDEFTRLSETAAKYVELLTQSIAAAQSANSWMGEPTSMYNQARALENTMTLPAEVWGSIRQSQPFNEVIPADRRSRAGLARDPRDFDFGADYYHSTPVMLAVVRKDGMAEEMGFKAGDRLVSADGRPLASVWDLKLLMRSKPGAKVVVVYERSGKQERREIKVPTNLPS